MRRAEDAEASCPALLDVNVEPAIVTVLPPFIHTAPACAWAARGSLSRPPAAACPARVQRGSASSAAAAAKPQSLPPPLGRQWRSAAPAFRA